MGKGHSVLNNKFFISLLLAAVLITASVLVFKIIKSDKFDVSLTSYDGEVIFLLAEAADEKPWNNQGPVKYAGFTALDRLELYQKCLDSPYYIDTVYFTDIASGKPDEGYLFCKDEHYFIITPGEDERYYLKDVVCEAYYFHYGGMGCFLPVLYHPADRNELSCTNEIDSFCLKWDQTLGLKNYDELISFYARLDPETYMIDAESRRIFIKNFDKFMNEPIVWSEQYAMVIDNDDEGIKISFLEDFSMIIRDAVENNKSFREVIR